MFLKQPINYWHIGFLALLTGTLWFTHVASVNRHVEQTTNVVTNKLNKEYQGKLDKAVADAIASTKILQADADKIEKAKYEKLQANNVSLSRQLDSLRNRPERPSSTVLTESSQSRGSCTATQLYREDAEFLTREAARAESVLIERNSIYDRYIAAKQELDRLATQPK